MSVIETVLRRGRRRCRRRRRRRRRRRGRGPRLREGQEGPNGGADGEHRPDQVEVDGSRRRSHGLLRGSGSGRSAFREGLLECGRR